MRCAACGADNSAEALRCSSCGEKISRRRSRRDLLDEVASPFARRPDSRQPLALWAYRCSVLSLIPLLGLVLGAVAVGLALLAWGPVRKEANGKSKGLVITALILALVTLVANGMGVGLMVAGLVSWR